MVLCPAPATRTIPKLTCKGSNTRPYLEPEGDLNPTTIIDRLNDHRKSQHAHEASRKLPQAPAAPNHPGAPPPPRPPKPPAAQCHQACRRHRTPTQLPPQPDPCGPDRLARHPRRTSLTPVRPHRRSVQPAVRPPNMDYPLKARPESPRQGHPGVVAGPEPVKAAP